MSLVRRRPRTCLRFTMACMNPCCAVCRARRDMPFSPCVHALRFEATCLFALAPRGFSRPVLCFCMYVCGLFGINRRRGAVTVGTRGTAQIPLRRVDAVLILVRLLASTADWRHVHGRTEASQR